MKLIIVAGLSIFLSSCASMSLKECKVADWEDVGYKDALSGHPSTEIKNHKKACAKAKIKPNKALYMTGFKKGEKEYCTYSNGLKAGEKNKSVSRICKASFGKDFHSGYDVGKKRYQIYKEIKTKNKQIEIIESKLNKIKDGKIKSSVKEVELMYREKELINKEISFLQVELDHLE